MFSPPYGLTDTYERMSVPEWTAKIEQDVVDSAGRRRTRYDRVTRASLLEWESSFPQTMRAVPD